MDKWMTIVPIEMNSKQLNGDHNWKMAVSPGNFSGSIQFKFDNKLPNSAKHKEIMRFAWKSLFHVSKINRQKCNFVIDMKWNFGIRKMCTGLIAFVCELLIRFNERKENLINFSFK